ncbi:hypothetical protein GWI33_020120 [Rhynchophorus ferrugineus]|uniref:Histone-lysine N-methyltransferase SETMAR n=1 Tax=Rhynchophorus ferrugineus TaxID=354439 RepID=A0A834HX36_RHYFE|nr:hypothetical protein GWI33_020120 [Rhynchophorus ferrugineus]
MDEKEFRVLVKYWFLKEKNTVETKTWLDAERSEMSTEDGERPKEVVTDENIKNIHKMILNDRKLKLNEIENTLKISTERVRHIIHEYLGMRKLCPKWVPHEFTFEQKQRQVDDSELCLKMIKRNKLEFMHRYVTMDETWLHHFTPKSNRQSSELTAYDEFAPKRGKT